MEKEKTAGQQKKHTSKEGSIRCHSLHSEPELHQEYRRQIAAQCIDRDQYCHRNLWKQTAYDNIRAVIAIIRKLKSIASASEGNPGRRQCPLLHAHVSNCLCQRHMLIVSVRSRTIKAPIRPDQTNQQYKDRHQNSGKDHCLQFFYFFIFTLFHHSHIPHPSHTFKTNRFRFYSLIFLFLNVFSCMTCPV